MRKTTPAQQQYLDLKQQHKEALLFFRMGDFYETFYEDAHIAHKILGITLTARHKQSDHPIPMAGIPHHSLDKYTKKLLQA
jgi:DNA mismatch repair protein MutS